MIELGKVQELEILRVKEFGVYVGEKAGDEASVLLPKKQVPEGAKIGDKVEVFIYKDSSDRLIATTGKPKLQVGETALLEVKDVAKIGAFLDMGLEKDLLLPFKEQTHPVRDVYKRQDRGNRGRVRKRQERDQPVDHGPSVLPRQSDRRTDYV